MSLILCQTDRLQMCRLSRVLSSSEPKGTCFSIVLHVLLALCPLRGSPKGSPGSGRDCLGREGPSLCDGSCSGQVVAVWVSRYGWDPLADYEIHLESCNLKKR